MLTGQSTVQKSIQPLGSISLGPFSLEHPFALAPMAGITNSPFRRLMKRRQSAFVVSELISAHGIEYAGQRTLDLLRFHPEERPVGLQIFGEDAQVLCHAARVIADRGADFVDLNLGCPVQKVVKKGSGAALCRDPRELGRILTALVRSVPIPVTIKIRTGWDAGSRNAQEVIQAAADAGVAWVAIHGRTRAQGYSGSADWDFIGDMKAKSPIPVLGNGDILHAHEAMSRYRTYGVDAVLIGRGALRNPFLFQQAAALFKGENPHQPVAADYVSMIDEQRALFEEVHPGRPATVQVRKFFAWYSSGFPGSHEFRARLFQSQADVSEVDYFWEDVKEFFSKSISARDEKIYTEPFLMGGHG